MVAARQPRSFCVGPMPYDCGTGNSDAPKAEYTLPAFVTNIVSPFMHCWQPPIPSNTVSSPTRSTRGGHHHHHHHHPHHGGPPVVSPHRGPASPQPHQQSQETINIREPHANDVLCGRGGSSNRHVGNLNFRSLVGVNKEMYVTLTKKQKMMVARKIVETIHSQNPPGRFLQKDPQTGLWFDIGIPRSLEKTSQALREKTPTPSGTTTPSTKSPLTAPVSPGGSTFTATTIATMDTLSDIGVSTPTLSPKSPPQTPPMSPGTATSSPVPTSCKSSSPSISATDVPEITIPEHLESQFRPKKVERSSPSRPHGPPPHLPAWDYRHHPPAPPHPAHHHPYHPPPPPPPHHHHRPPPPHPSSMHDPYYHYPPHAPPPPHPAYSSPVPPHYAHDYRDPRSYRPAHPYAAPQYVPSSSSTPASPDRRDIYHPDLRAKSSGTPGRQTTEVSPGRAQVSKKRRTVDALAKEAQNLSLREHSGRVSLMDSIGSSTTTTTAARGSDSTTPTEASTKRPPAPVSPGPAIQMLRSPSTVLQSRSRRVVANKASNGGADALAGLAALSSAALLKLDAEGTR